MAVDKISFFEDFLKKKPADDFARYALAMEYAKADRTDDALSCYEALITQNPNYSAGYMQSALLLQRLGRLAEAVARMSAGVEAATRAKDAHARREMQGFLDEMEQQLSEQG